MSKILVIDDDKEFADSIQEWLEFEHHQVDTVYSATDACHYLESFDYELLILDWNMPAMTGLELCKRYRSSGGNAYIIMLTGLTATDSKVQGLDAGADDYVAKPVEIKELLSRVRALLRRPLAYRGQVRQAGDLSLDSRSRVVTKCGAEIQLKPLEFTLLEFFMQHPHEVFAPEALLKSVWDSSAEASVDSVYACINRLRKKLDQSDKESLIKTVHGIGYRFDP